MLYSNSGKITNLKIYICIAKFIERIAHQTESNEAKPIIDNHTYCPPLCEPKLREIDIVL